MPSTLYVGNLPWNTTPEDINDFFGQYGEVIRSRIITDRESGRSRGFGFVEVAEGDAERMATDLNGKVFGGRPLTVNEARPKQVY
ncbi:MAG TPA: RNA-binding protein [Desulfitobacteriaceae bacterium]|jgi:RNA recognition motif-containing protein|nr:RNA-binding protein [Desulfitobacteriaceae bacterium]